jgi:peptide/nickel transport system substrate-binding protein
VEMDETGTPAGCLAENWSKSDDGLVWTFNLRKDIKWHSGRELNAADITFTLDQIKALTLDPVQKCAYGYVTDYLSSWEASADGRSVSLTLRPPFFGMLHAMTFPILPADGGYENGQAPKQPIGTGPYEVSVYEEGKSIDLAANEDWWKKQPNIPQIKVMAFTDNAAQLSSLILSQLDAAQTEDLTVAQYRDSGDANLYEYPTRYFEFMAVNFTSPDLNSKKIRQAIAYAINRKEIVSYTYVNHAIVCDTPVSPDSWLYNGKLLKYDHNIDQARQLIMLAGWKDNFKADGTAGQDGFWDTSPDGVKRDLRFTLLTNRDETSTLRYDAALLIAGQLEEAGIRVEVKSAAWKDYDQMLKQRVFDLALCGSYLSPVPDYSALFASGGKLNIGGYHSADVDGMLQGILEASDANMLKLRIDELQNAVIEDLPIISLYFRTHSLLTVPDLRNVSGPREESAYARISQWYIGK